MLPATDIAIEEPSTSRWSGVTVSCVLGPTPDEWVQRVNLTAVGISTPVRHGGYFVDTWESDQS
jgi:hypothetical protein